MNDLDDAMMIGLNEETETRPELGKVGRILCIASGEVEETTGVTSLGVKDTFDLVRATRTIQEYDPGIIVSSLND